MKNVILFDKGCEDFIREALGLSVKSDGQECAFGYVNKDVAACEGVPPICYSKLWQLLQPMRHIKSLCQ